ncbi:hypothetical protein Tco_0036705, partial [Tanacetum coccineum]
TQDEGASSERLFDEQPSPSPAPTSEVPYELSFSKKHRVHKESVSKQGRKIAKGESSVQRDPLFDVMLEDKIDHMETENAQSKGRTREMVNEGKEIDERILSTKDVLSTDKEGVSTDFEKVSTDRPIVSTDFEKVSTDRQIVSTDGSKVSTNMQIEGTDEQVEGTEEHNEGTEEKNEGIEEIFKGTEEQREGTEEKVESTDEQIKEKGVELKDVEEIGRPRPTSQRSLLTLKPLPKIDPKDKGKKKIEEEDESRSLKKYKLCMKRLRGLMKISSLLGLLKMKG